MTTSILILGIRSINPREIHTGATSNLNEHGYAATRWSARTHQTTGGRIRLTGPGERGGISPEIDIWLVRKLFIKRSITQHNTYFSHTHIHIYIYILYTQTCFLLPLPFRTS